MSKHMFTFDGTAFLVHTLVDWVPLQAPGLYMFCRRERDGSVTILYIGECECFEDRLNRKHHKIKAAFGFGMNEIHQHILHGPRQQRIDLETKLRGHYKPILNDQGLPTLPPVTPFNALYTDKLPLLQPYSSFGW